MMLIDLCDGLRRQLSLIRANEIVQQTKIPCRMTPESMSTSGDRMEVDHIELAPDKTFRMFIKGGAEPIRMYPDVQSVWFIAYYKRFIPLMIHNLTGMGWTKRIITFLAIKYNFEIVPKWFEHIFSTYQPRLRSENYSQPVKEVRRVLRGMMDGYLLDALTLILEYDSGYRYRFQDIIAELNKEALAKNPAKEVMRLLDVLTFREGLGKAIDPASKWQKLKRLIPLLFFVCPKIKRQVVKILTEMNIDEVKFDKSDLYWINKNSCHLFRGMPIEAREAENNKLYG